MIRRLVLVLLAVLLPAQFAWAAVTSYCGHESGQSAHHLGHHEHVHKIAKAKSGEVNAGQDNDCATCHSAGAPAMTSVAMPSVPAGLAQAPAAQAPVRRLSPPPRIPERPQWARLA